MASKEQLEALDKLLSRQERTIRNAFNEFISEVQSGPVIDAILRELQQGQIARAIAIMDSYIDQFSLSLGRVIDDYIAREKSA